MVILEKTIQKHSLVPPAFTDKDITLTEGTSENLGSYSVSLDGSAWSDGLYVLRVHDTSLSNICIAASLFGVSGGMKFLLEKKMLCIHQTLI